MGGGDASRFDGGQSLFVASRCLGCFYAIAVRGGKSANDVTRRHGVSRRLHKALLHVLYVTWPRRACSLSRQMYHTFTVTSPRVRTQANDGTEQPRISTSTACVECRRKKTRCGGGQPCQQCAGIDRPELCKYARRARKTMPSRRWVQAVPLQAIHLLTECVQPGRTASAYDRSAVCRLLTSLPWSPDG